MKILNNKEAKAAFAIGLHLNVQDAGGKWQENKFWLENGVYYTNLTNFPKWDISKFIEAWFGDPTTVWGLDCPQGNKEN